MSKKKIKIRDNDPESEREINLYDNPIPSRELILQVMSDHGIPINKKELLQILEIKDDEIAIIEKRLRAMVRQGQILINRKNVICISDKLNLIPGRVSGHPDGFGFLIPDDDTQSDIFLTPREMSQVFNNDRVMIQVTGQDRKGKPRSAEQGSRTAQTGRQYPLHPHTRRTADRSGGCRRLCDVQAFQRCVDPARHQAAAGRSRIDQRTSQCHCGARSYRQPALCVRQDDEQLAAVCCSRGSDAAGAHGGRTEREALRQDRRRV